MLLYRAKARQWHRRLSKTTFRSLRQIIRHDREQPTQKPMSSTKYTGCPVVVIPTNLPVARVDLNDLIYLTTR